MRFVARRPQTRSQFSLCRFRQVLGVASRGSASTPVATRLSHSVRHAGAGNVALMKGQILILEATYFRRGSPPSAAAESISEPLRNQRSSRWLDGVADFRVCPAVCDCGLPYGTRLALLPPGGRVCAAPPVRARLPFIASALASDLRPLFASERLTSSVRTLRNTGSIARSGPAGALALRRKSTANPPGISAGPPARRLAAESCALVARYS